MVENFFLFLCCSRRGDSGAIKDEAKIRFFQTEGRKKLAEAGPPGKRPRKAEAGNRLSIHKKHFINSLKAFQTEFV
ncbi:MAG: hypothetical protein EA344_03080 [Alkalicoccus sp.]|nr:MAG: hypothetical protein EA344_03080 [Alkalicoccus sp.]